MANKRQTALIHTAKTRLGIKEEDYRAMLSGFGVESSKDLNTSQVQELMQFFESLGFKHEPAKEGGHPVLSNGKNKARFNPAICDYYATPKQIGLIRHLWYNHPHVRVKTPASLNSFLRRIVKVDRLEWLPRRQVSCVIRGIEAIGPKENKK